MTVAIKVLNDILRKDFGFKHLLFVFSGRRGVHCWVCDQNARMLSNAERAALCDYIAVNVEFSTSINKHETGMVVTYVFCKSCFVILLILRI